MNLECPKCRKEFTISDSTENITQTCSKCTMVLRIKKLKSYENASISIYEISEFVEEAKAPTFDPFGGVYC